MGTMYQSTPDYYNDYISHASHKYIDKYMGKNGKWVYVYKKNPYEAMNEGMENLRGGIRKTAKRATIGALSVNNQFNKYMNKKAKKVAIGALSKNQQFNNYMNKKVSDAGKKVAGEASKRYSSAKNRATSEINKRTSAVRKNASSVYNTAAGKAKSAYSSGVSTYNTAAGKAKSSYNTAAGKAKKAYSSAKSSYNTAKSNLEKAYKKEKSKAAGRKLISKHNQNRMVKNWVESDAAAYTRAIKKTRKDLKRRKSK